MKEGLLNVQLVDRTILGEGKGEDGPNGGELDNEDKGLILVHSRTLSEAPKGCNEPCSEPECHP
jgi:hypothetical protein